MNLSQTRVPALAVLLVALTTPAQETAPKTPATDPALVQWLEQLDAALADKNMARDAQACGLLQQIAAAYARGLDAPMAKKVVAAAAGALTRGRLRTPDAQLYASAAIALAQMGADGAKALMHVHDSKRFPFKAPWVPTRALLVLNVGRSREVSAVEWLCERATRDPEEDVMAAAGAGLGEFAEADQKVRKHIAKELIGKLGEVEASANQPNANPAQQTLANASAGRTLQAIARKWTAALRRLTRQDFENGTDWQRWWNKNKDKDWDKGK